MFKNETAEEMMLKGLEGRYKTRKEWLEDRIRLRREMESQGWVAGVDLDKNTAIRTEYEQNLAYLETEYTRARNLLVGTGLADYTVDADGHTLYHAINR